MIGGTLALVSTRGRFHQASMKSRPAKRTIGSIRHLYSCCDRSAVTPSACRPRGRESKLLPPAWGRKRCQEPFSCFLGRPCARKVLSSPSRRTTWSDQNAPPKGHPRFTERRSATSSASVCGLLTSSTQSAKRRTGQADRSDLSLVLPQHQRDRLPHRHSSARRTRFARKAFRSTYRQSVKKCSSSLTGNDLNRP